MTYRTRVQGLALVIVMLLTPVVWAETHREYHNGATCTDISRHNIPYFHSYVTYLSPSIAICHLTMTDHWTPANLNYVWVGANVGGDGWTRLTLCVHNGGAPTMVACGEPQYLRQGQYWGVILYPPQIPPYPYMFGAYVQVYFNVDTSASISAFEANWSR
jgi:hypothetical protein